MVTTKQEQTAGEPVATKLKQYFFPDTPWSPKLAFHIGHMLGALKREVKIYLPDKDVLAQLHFLNTFTKEDMQDALDAQKFQNNFKEEVTCDTVHGDPKRAGAILR